MTETNKTALIAGATGLVGHHLIGLLLESGQYDKVISIGRKKLGITHDKLSEIEVQKFDDIAGLEASVLKCDDVYCCLGTTMKRAGSKEAFYQVDYTYPLLLAKLTQQHGAKRFSLISAKGADQKSIFYYNKVKGQIEEAIKQLNFKHYFIFRPSLLMGERNEKRVGEDIAKTISKRMPFLFSGPLKKFRPIHAKEVAMGMIRASAKVQDTFKIFESEEIKQL